MADYRWLNQDMMVKIPVQSIVNIICVYSAVEIDLIHERMEIPVKNRVQTQAGIVLDLVQEAWKQDRLFALVFQAMLIDARRWDEYL